MVFYGNTNKDSAHNIIFSQIAKDHIVHFEICMMFFTNLGNRSNIRIKEMDII